MVLTIEYKINLLAPAKGQRFRIGQVVKPGRTVTVTEGRGLRTCPMTGARN
jgi:acyl-coenzyme A thioesterase PaaI-like protein